MKNALSSDYYQVEAKSSLEEVKYIYIKNLTNVLSDEHRNSFFIPYKKYVGKYIGEFNDLGQEPHILAVVFDSDFNVELFVESNP